MLAWLVRPDPATQTLAHARAGSRLYCIRWIGDQFYLFTAFERESWRYHSSSRSVELVADAADRDAAG